MPHTPVLIHRREVGGAIGCAILLLLGWSALAVPSLVRQVESEFGQTDAGWRITSSALTVRGKVPGIDAATFK